MTNREWLGTLSDEEFAEWIVCDALDIGRRYTDSALGLEEWLKRKRNQISKVKLSNSNVENGM